MIPGCAKEPPPARPVPPPVVDLAPVRCPPLDPGIRAELSRTTPRPGPDTIDTDGVAGYSRDAVRGWIGRLEQSERKKTAAGLAAVDAYDRCREPWPAGPRDVPAPVAGNRVAIAGRSAHAP
jgi:hypothetical protein